MAEREIVLLSGMHRSGTSALARVFGLLGAVLPEPLVPPALGNELGHWEPAEAVAMNDAALLAAGGDVNGLHPLAAEWTGGAGAETFTETLRAWLERVAPVGALTVVKDPRIALLAPFWRAAVERLGARPRFVVSWRDPWEVARSLSSRQLEHFPDEVWPHARVELLWLRHQLELERASRGALRSFAAYGSLLDDWRPLMARLYAELELGALDVTPEQGATVDRFLRPDARRQRRPASADASASGTAEVLRLLEARVGKPQGGAQAFDRAGARFDDAVRLLGGYVRALEARVAVDDALTGDARTLVASLRETALAAELRAVESARRSEAGSDPGLAVAALEDLRGRHEGLRRARARLVDELRLARGDAEARDATLRREHAHEVEALRSAAAAARSDGRARRERAARDARELKAAAVESERRLALERGVSQRAQAEAERLRGEVEDHRVAYEALRAEAATARAEARGLKEAAAAIASERERTDIEREREGGQALGDLTRRTNAAAAAAAQAADAQVDALRAEIEALRASASWRATRPIRSVTFRLRRLVRR